MFKGKKKLKETTLQRPKVTYIAQEIEVTGDLKGEGAIQVEGTLVGDISVGSLVIGEHGVVTGSVTATKVILNGKLNGKIFCDTLEIMPNGYISDSITVQKVFIAGKSEGNIEAKEEIIIDSMGMVSATIMKSKNIRVDGIFKGNVIATQLLEIGSTGSVEGEITVKNIKTHEGGKLLGSMQNYVQERGLFTEIGKS